MDSRKCFKNSRGFTIIEVSIVTGLLLILAAFLLPAIQAARESAWRTRCSSNMRQIGMALASYEAANGCYPHTVEALRAPSNQIPTPPAITIRYYSVHSRLLPYCEQSDHFQSINFQLEALPPRLAEKGGRTDGGALANATAIGKRVSLYVCPSDGSGAAAFSAPASYRCTLGVGPYPVNSVEFPDSGDGAFGGVYPRRLAELTDGLSHTVVFSERLIGRLGSSDRAHPSLIHFVLDVGRSAESAASACSAVTTANYFETVGSHWYYSGTEYTWYNHVLTPNSQIPDCGVSATIPLVGAFTARSRHPGGVNVLAADGSVRFAIDSLNGRVWQALATKGNNDLGVLPF